MKTKLAVLGLLALAFMTTGLGCKQSGEARSFKPVTLEYWGVFETEQDIRALTGPYTSRHPKVNLQYRRLREDEYKLKMLEAWARGQGPDLFMIPVTRLREFIEFIQPMPAVMKAPVEFVQGTIKKETITEIREYHGYTSRQLRELFIDTVANDVVIGDKIYGLPYSIDTLSVYYNRSLLKNSNIPLPAKSWQELLQQAPLLSKIDGEGNLVQSTIALGTTNNISNVFDIVSTIMMQIGITMGTGQGPVFQQDTETLNAVQFFLSFAQEGLQNYSWNEQYSDALDAFTAGKLAYFIGYPYHSQMITQTNPSLDWDVVPMFAANNAEATPNYANYWITVVAKPPAGSSAEEQTKAELAWQYLLESTQAQNVRPFLNSASNRRVTALRGLVTEQQTDVTIGPFVQNLLTAESWYRGYNFQLAEEYFVDMIENIKNAFSTGIDPTPFINAGASQISQTYRAPQ